MPKKLTTVEFISLSNDVHNFKYDYSLTEYVNSRVKVQIICPIHGSFWQLPTNHLKGCGCKLCSNEYISKIKFDTLDSVIAKFIKVHSTRYDYSKVVYVDSVTPVEIVCPIHGSFWQSPANHISGKGCARCGYDRTSANRINLADYVLNKFDLVHGSRYDYSKMIYLGTNIKIEIVCKQHGSFWQTPKNHYRGKGCPKCSHHVSSPGSTWLDSLNIPTIIREFRLPENRRMPVDGYDPVTNTIYQFHGDYWHGGPMFDKHDVNKTIGVTFMELYEGTIRSDQQLRDWGYNLVVMWESDWKTIRQTVVT